MKSFLSENPIIFIACKHSSDSAVKGASHIIKWFQKYLPKANLLLGPKLQSRLPKSALETGSLNVSFVKEESESELKDSQMVISCGGDGTLLHISSLFQRNPCPPVLSFSLGSLGFLSSFDFSEYKIVLSRVFKDKFTLLTRQRLQIEGEPIPNGKKLILNEILLNRISESKHVPEFEFSLNPSDKLYFPSAIADALILSTATGSSGHSLSAGGPILHPELGCGVLNFLAPRTLSFRPLIVPFAKENDGQIKLGLHENSRATSVDIHLDGLSVGRLAKDQLINVSLAENSMPVFSCFGSTPDWNYRLSTCLNWNRPYQDTSNT